MTKEEIQDGKKLIAEYMGFIYDGDWVKFKANNGRWIENYHLTGDYDYPTWKPNEDWNQLMVVCKKIVESYFDKREDIFAGLIKIDIEKTFSAVVEFIKFWNDDSQPKLIWNK
jgi:hypothetical protein